MVRSSDLPIFVASIAAICTYCGSIQLEGQNPMLWDTAWKSVAWVPPPFLSYFNTYFGYFWQKSLFWPLSNFVPIRSHISLQIKAVCMAKIHSPEQKFEGKISLHVFKTGLEIRLFEKNSRRKKLKTQGKNSITQGKNSSYWQFYIRFFLFLAN